MGWKNELFPHLPDDPNPRVFLDLAVGPTPVGRVVIILKADKAPKTCENFRCLCTGEKGVDSKGRKLHFKGSSFHRVVPDFLLQGGDVVHPDALDPMNGAGQTSIYQSEENPDGFFDCEYNSLRHAGPGVISMANQGPNTNGSQFMIELRAHPFFDHLHTVFGVLYEGLPVLRVVERYGTPMNGSEEGGAPTEPVRIINCGQLFPPGEGPPDPPEPPEAAAAKRKRQQDRANYDSRNPPILHSVDINRAKLMPNASSEYVASLLYQPPEAVEGMMARKQTTDSDDEAAVDRLLASWPVGTLATDEERAKMGMEPMDPEERVKRQAEIDQDPIIQDEIARLEGEGLQVAGRPPPPKVPKRKKTKRKKPKKQKAFVLPPREPERRAFSPMAEPMPPLPEPVAEPAAAPPASPLADATNASPRSPAGSTKVAPQTPGSGDTAAVATPQEAAL